MSPDIIVPVMVLLLPAGLVFIHKHFRYKEKLLELQARGAAPPLQLPAQSATADKRLIELEERVQNLESIIVAMDTELGVLPERASRDEVRRLRGTATPALPAASAIAAAPKPPKLDDPG